MRKWLKTLRDKNSLTQRDLADLLNISQNYYCNIENGVKQVDLNLSTASKLSDIFNIPLSTIRNYEEAMRRRD